MYEGLEEFIKKDKYKKLTVRVLQNWHRQGDLKVIRGERGRLLTTEVWLEQAINIIAMKTENKTSMAKGKVTKFKHIPLKNRGLNYVV
jgi:hypothetical protein